jgi:hypothetical protein
MEKTTLSHLKNMKNIYSKYIKELKDGGYEITSDEAEAFSNIEKQIDIEINNIMEAPLSMERNKKAETAIFNISKLSAKLIKLIGEDEPELAFKVSSTIVNIESVSDIVESIINNN